ncbi:X-prolyl aminopeptidase, putative [Eimeria tenella]|uniref:X-prolyl aminopeptidase, putative n=1 Tax=Eimeria tenella TaxID=5802 RepID=U6KLZ3_EIMTE|nr:X-prolyl aminopeptidase, putative [Eimeria tenella]CDJ39001.1 X-prolyl aminopeptidase, putative [Eimeria tenella]|eukprot:XP_013229756.1 X-prolyl aminopeptidase, putative [Eimeria tenella]
MVSRGVDAAAAERLGALRLLLQAHQLDGLIVDDADAHGSEIPARAFARRTFLSNFSGSNGLALVTRDSAFLWTDGRYFSQAEQQLPVGLWQLMKSDFGNTPTLTQFLKQETKIRRLGVDAFTTSLGLLSQIKEAGFNVQREAQTHQGSQDASVRHIIPLDQNLVDEIWGVQRPVLPSSSVYAHPKEFRGLSTREKVARTVQTMAKEGADLLLLSSLDEVAWLTNLRGSDSPNSTVFYSYALLAKGPNVASTEDPHCAKPCPWRLLVYTDPTRVSSSAKAELETEGAVLRPYESLASDLQLLLTWNLRQQQQLLQREHQQLPEDLQQQTHGGLLGAVDWLLAGGDETRHEPRSKLQITGALDERRAAWLDPKINLAIHRILADSKRLIVKDTPVSVAKAAKDEKELKGMAEAHEDDGVALATFFCWFEKQLLANARATMTPPQQQEHGGQECSLTEWTLKEAVDASREAMSDLFRGTSFASISCFGSNCALAHYRPDPETSLQLKARMSEPQGLLCVTVRGPGGDPPAQNESPVFLLDSGGQYLTGTTDVTRTLHLGEPTDEQKEAYTLVLKGMIGLSAQKFPEGSKGPQIDALARQHLWNRGLDYMHGTGHGVGHFLNVHEGPIGISPRLTGAASLHEMQPGAVLSIEPGFYKDKAFGIRIENLAAVKPSGLSHRGRRFLEFDSLTLVPIQARLIDASLLTRQEIAWLDAYHQRVFTRISSRLTTKGKDFPFRPPLPQAVSVTSEEVRLWLKKNTQPLHELLQTEWP